MSNTTPLTRQAQVGDTLTPLTLPPLSRLTLALYCGASGDHNPIHVDSDFAKTAGQKDVIAHGMLSMAWLAHLLTNWVPQRAIQSFNVRFAAITHVGETITCTGRVVEALEPAGRVRLEVSTANERGEVKLSGEAVVDLNLI